MICLSLRFGWRLDWFLNRDKHNLQYCRELYAAESTECTRDPTRKTRW